MIARAHRFHGYGSLHYVYRHGKTVRSITCALKYAPNSRRSTYRCAVVVSKKVSKSAVVRNRIRRRIYEIIRKHESAIAGPYDLVITVFSTVVAELPANELDKMIHSLLARAGVLDKTIALRATSMPKQQHER